MIDFLSGRVYAFVVLPLVLALFPGASAQAEALQFRGDAAHSGVYASPAVPALDRVKWKFKTGAKVVSTPAVSGGTVYVGSADHFVYALKATDGSIKWRYRTGGAVNSSPAVAAGTVFVASFDGDVYALDAVDGKLKWKFKTGGERRFTAPGIHGAMPRTELMADPFDVFLSSPTVVGETVYVGSGDHHIYAIDAQSGAKRWAFETGNVVHASPAVAAGVLYIGLAASVAAFICWNRGVAIVGASAAGFTLHLLPAFGTALAMLALGEAFHAYHAAGFATILAGVVLATRRAGPAQGLR